MGDIAISDAAAPSLQGSNALPQPSNDVAETAIPPTYDLGNLLITNSTPLPPLPSSSDLHHAAKTAAQSLLTQLLLTCPIYTNNTSSSTAAVLMTLPPPNTSIPREKQLPPAANERPKTKWERFAEKKGINSKSKKGETGKKVYDEERGEWVEKYGFKGKNKRDAEEEWIVEVDEKKERRDQDKAISEATVGQSKRERKERARRNERKMRANERRETKGQRAVAPT